jgi:hypothetical protein
MITQISAIGQKYLLKYFSKKNNIYVIYVYLLIFLFSISFSANYLNFSSKIILDTKHVRTEFINMIKETVSFENINFFNLKSNN